jgi:hypothetical protein
VISNDHFLMVEVDRTQVGITSGSVLCLTNGVDVFGNILSNQFKPNVGFDLKVRSVNEMKGEARRHMPGTDRETSKSWFGEQIFLPGLSQHEEL